MNVRVAVIGNHRHHHCSEAQWARAFTQAGCTVTPVQVDEVAYDPDAAMALLREQQLVTYTRTHSAGMYLDLTWADRWAELERLGVQTIGMHLDRFWDLEREALIHYDPQFRVGTLWTADGGNDYRWLKAGVNHRWLKPAVDSEAVHGGEAKRELAYDVVFVGSAHYHHEYPERDQLIDHLRARYGRRRFAHFGHGGDHPVVRGQALNDLYASARVVVGDSCFANCVGRRAVPNYWSDRIPETLARGGFLIHPWMDGLTDWFTSGQDLILSLPDNLDDLDTLIDAYLAAPSERERIAAHGRRTVLGAHTWRDRAIEILAAHGLGPPLICVHGARDGWCGHCASWTNREGKLIGERHEHQTVWDEAAQRGRCLTCGTFA